MAIKAKTKQNQDSIFIKGARVHNLKNVDVELPKNKLIVITGVSGSGKSSLTIDTLYAEGQRRYVESLSSYARQFLNRMNKPDVDYIKGICPAIAIEQKVITRSSRSTVGSLTEIYDYLRLLYARVGKTFSPISGKEVKKHEVSDVLDFIFMQKADAKLMILSPLKVTDYPNRSLFEIAQLLNKKGFSRLKINEEVVRIKDLNEKEYNTKKLPKETHIVIDRITATDNEANRSRVGDSVQIAFYESGGDCIIEVIDGKKQQFNNRFELDGMAFEQPSPLLFSFNNPYGACDRCEGFGTIIGIDEDLVVPNKNLSIYDGAVVCWRGDKMKAWQQRLIKNAIQFDFPVHRSFKELTNEERQLLWTGNEWFNGLNDFFAELESQSYKIQYRVMLSRYRGRTVCTDCFGSRLRKDTQYVKINETSINELVNISIDKVATFFETLKLNKLEQQIAKRILLEVNNRIKVMQEVGLGYLTLNRLSNTLSGGETQRINLTRSIGSNLTSSMYILDEPSIGLHPRDTDRLIKVLKKLRDLGNTVIVVEHDEEIIREADHLVDMGPLAGIYGGEVTFNGPAKNIPPNNGSLTGKYLSGAKAVLLPKHRRKTINHIDLIGASQHNLKKIDVKIPLNQIVVVTGVSGSGKTTLVKDILHPALNRHINQFGEKPGHYEQLTGDLKCIEQIEMIDQNPLGRSSRSNPITYIKAYDVIRNLFTKQKIAKVRGYKPKHFSFNVEGGRCETCKGDGFVTIEMQFLADVKLLCDECDGKRFKKEILEVKYSGKNVFEVLDMSVDEAMVFFEKVPEVFKRIKPLQDVGLGYVKLGQSSSTLSGGEAQRVKLASYLGKESATKHILFIFDEPSTGLHFDDITKLMTAFNALVENGHSIIIIEHNLDIIKCADYIIDLGPEGGEAGGHLVFQGKPEDLVKVKESYTGSYLKEKL